MFDVWKNHVVKVLHRYHVERHDLHNEAKEQGCVSWHSDIKQWHQNHYLHDSQH